MRKIYAITTLLVSSATGIAQQASVTYGEINHREAHMTIESNYWYNEEWPDGFLVMSETDTVFLYMDALSGHGPRIYRAEGLTPNTRYVLHGWIYAQDYHHEVLDSLSTFSTPVDFMHRSFAPDFTFVAGSCSYVNDPQADRPGSPYGGDYQIYDHMSNESADFNFWLGDNVYTRPSDFSSAYGIYHRYTQSRANDQLRNLLESRPNLAIWDDHDAGPNNCVGTYEHIESTRQAFMNYWPRGDYQEEKYGDLRWIHTYSDVVFIGLDNRSHRTSEHSGNPQILGKEQIDWLVSQVRFHRRASFVIIAIGGQVLHSEAIYENYAQYPEERQYLLNELSKIGTNNIVFLTGDRHHSEVSQLEHNGIRFTEYTISPLSSGPSTVVQDETNENRVGDYIAERNYARLSVVGDASRTLYVTYFNSNGEKIFKHELTSI